jgi:hypothetical protein
LRLLHYTEHPWPKRLKWCDRAPVDEIFKPSGIWVTTEGEDSWFNWCIGERFNIERLQFVHRVHLRAGARICWIMTVEELDAFTAKYGVSPYPGGARIWIDWRRVMTTYDGLIIPEYFWERRNHFETSWYYTWDCASGCIWNRKAITRVTPHAMHSLDSLINLTIDRAVA